MHDPTFLIADIGSLRLDIWHDEPGGADAGEVCGWPDGSNRWWWAWRHRKHLHYRFWPYLNVKRWILDRCAECGRRFLWKDSRHGYQSSERKVYHDTCMSLRHVKSQLADLTGYVRGTADSNARWRAEYRLNGLDSTDAEGVQAGG